MRHIRGLVYCALTLMTFACSSGSEEGSSDDLVNAFTVSGSIGDGPIVGAEVTVLDANGNVVTSTTSDTGAGYSVEIPGQTPLPVTVRVQGGTDLVTQRAADFELIAALHSVGEQTINVSPLSTLAVRAAQCRGDISPEGLELAWQAMNAGLNVGLDTGLLPNPMTSPIDANNLETAVLANEAAGEWVRRAGIALENAGFATSLDEIVEVLACDAADGTMDGNLVSAVGNNDTRILAVSKAAEVAVRLEVLAGRLEVDGVDATGAMNAAIRSVLPSFTDPDVNRVDISAAALSQLVEALGVLQGVYDDEELVEFMLLVSEADAGNARALVDAALSAGPQNAFQGLAGRVGLADASAIEEINARQQNQDEALAPIVSFSADPAQLTAGESTTLSWASSHADRCEATGAWSGDRDANGTFTTGPLTSSTSFALTCTGIGGVTRQVVGVTVDDQPQPDAPTVSLNASATTIDAGGQVTLSWSSSDASSCSASGGWNGSRATSGQVQVGPIETNTSFSLTCSGDGGSASDAVSVTVVLPTPAPTVTLSANAGQIDAGGNVTLSWSSSNATSCAASGAWNGSLTTSGSATVGPLQSTSTFVLNCSGAGGSSSDSVSVTVVPAPIDPPTVNLATSASQVNEGDSVTLSWSSSNANTCTASGAWSGSRGISGSATVGPLQANSTFALNCSGAGGSSSDTVSVTVTPEPVDPPTVNLTSSASQVGEGDSVTLSWSSANASSCTAAGAWSGSRSTSGSASVGPLQANSTFVLNCSGEGGSSSDTVSVSVTPDPVDPPTVSLTSSASQVSAGDAVTLSWSTTNAESCSASGDWSGSRGTSGNASSGALQANSQFVLTCAGQGGSTSASVNVAVTPVDPPTLSLTASESQVNVGDNVTLNWSATDADSCTASGGWNGARGVSGQEVIASLQSNTTFTLNCSGAGGNVVEMVNVNVIGSLTISWQAPTLDVNGNPVSGISTYRIHYGSSRGQYDDIVEVSGAAASHTLTLPMGTYYLAMSAVNNLGEESALSNEIEREAL